jgi:uncharacterized membrane protein YcaP (DUF421 family)
MQLSDLVLLSAIAVRTAIVYVVLVVGIRITGKRQTGEMSLNDLILVLLQANAVQNSMTEGNGGLAVALVSASTLIGTNWLLSTWFARHPSWQPTLLGSPTVIVENGHMIGQRARREGVTMEELLGAVRDQGLMDLRQVKLAVLEIDGGITVVPRERGEERS